MLHLDGGLEELTFFPRCGYRPEAASLEARHATLTHTHNIPPHTHSWAHLDELVVDDLSDEETKTLQQMDASCRERVLLAGVRVLVGGPSGANCSKS